MAGEDRSQQATPKRRQDARKEGQVVRSRELTSALALLAVVLLIGWQTGIRIGPWRSLLSQMLGAARKGNEQMVGSIAPVLGMLFLRWLAAPFALLWSVAVLSSIAQGGLVFSVNGLQPKWERLNPATNIGHLFSMAGLSRMLKSLLPVAVIIYMAVQIGDRDWMQVEASSRASSSMLLGWMFSRWLRDRLEMRPGAAGLVGGRLFLPEKEPGKFPEDDQGRSHCGNRAIPKAIPWCAGTSANCAGRFASGGR